MDGHRARDAAEILARALGVTPEREEADGDEPGEESGDGAGADRPGTDAG